MPPTTTKATTAMAKPQRHPEFSLLSSISIGESPSAQSSNWTASSKRLNSRGLVERRAGRIAESCKPYQGERYRVYHRTFTIRHGASSAKAGGDCAGDPVYAGAWDRRVRGDRGLSGLRCVLYDADYRDDGRVRRDPAAEPCGADLQFLPDLLRRGYDFPGRGGDDADRDR